MPTEARSSEQASISFAAELSTIADTTLVRLPEQASEQLPSRGQVAVRGSMGGHDFEAVVEPDGRRGHWIRVDETLQRVAGVGPGDIAEVALHAVPDWPEPDVPDDLAVALAKAPAKIRNVWQDITPMARWEWVRWVQATSNAQTRQRRVEVSISKMDSGKRPPAASTWPPAPTRTSPGTASCATPPRGRPPTPARGGPPPTASCRRVLDA